MSNNQTVSLIIPTLNGESRLDNLLSSLERQTVLPDEILLVDSGSTDATITIAEQHMHKLSGLRLQHIKKKDFDHGGTLTRAARQTSGDVLVFMTHDAVTAENNSLEKLLC